MALHKATSHPLLTVVFLVVALQWSHIMHCEGRVANLNSNTIVPGSQGERLYALDATSTGNPSGNVLDDIASTVTGATVSWPFLQSIVNLLNFWAATGEKNQQQLDFGNEIEVEGEEKFFNTSGAGFVYNAENQEEQESNDDPGAGEPHLLMPYEKKTKTCKTGNYIDDCWRCDPNWQSHRQQLAFCAIGFGRKALGGKNGPIYTVTSNADDDMQTPAPGTLRYGVTRTGPLWIVFAKSMTIELKGELEMTSFKTIDGRGAEVHLVGTSQITIEKLTNVIIHGIHVHDIVNVSGKFEGDAIHIRNSSHVWIDHCYLSNAFDGLVDVTKNSTGVTVSNCFFENQDKVMLLGASAKDDFDRNMQVTVAFNKFGPNLKQRMPRCRYGNCHVANNFYTSGWGLYAMGGSEDPTILSQANRFIAPDASNRKEVTRRMNDGGPTFGGWEQWDWVSTGDSFANGAFFTGSGVQNASASNYNGARSFVPRHASWVQAMTQDAGPLKCVPRIACYQSASNASSRTSR